MIGITGATGFIGSYLSDRLPFPQKRLSRHIHNSKKECAWIQGDLLNQHDCQLFVKDTSTLLHLACTSTPRTSNQNMIQDVHDNVAGALSLFENFAKLNPNGHIIFSSTGGNMYEATSSSPHGENDPALPRSSYGVHKLAIEHYLRLICSLYGIRGTILRMSNPYGTLLPSKRAQGLIGVAFSKLLNKETLEIIESMDTVRDYIHLDDIVDACKLVINKPPKIGECRLFNLSSGQGHSISTVLEIIENVSSHSIHKKLPSSELVPTSSVLSYGKLQQAMGWCPKMTLEKGIEQMWRGIN